MENEVITHERSPVLPATPQASGLNFIEGREVAGKSKTSLRMRYEAEATVIRRQVGGLEQARASLGLSQRKMCQLLLVDPSAWTRWVKDEGRVPPHIWRSIQWYLELEQKQPQWAQWREYVLRRQSDMDLTQIKRDLEAQIQQISTPQSLTKVESELSRLRDENLQLIERLEKRDSLGLGWKLLLLINSMAVGYWLLRALW